MQPARPGQKAKSPNEASGEKYEGKVKKEFTSFCCKNGSVKLCVEEDLRTYPYKMQKRHELSTTDERMRLDRCQPILNLMKTDLVFTGEKKFDVRQCLNHRSRGGSAEGRRVSRRPIHFLWWCGWKSQPLGDFHLFLYPQEWNWGYKNISDILEDELLPWDLGLFNKTPLRTWLQNY